MRGMFHGSIPSALIGIIREQLLNNKEFILSNVDMKKMIENQRVKLKAISNWTYVRHFLFLNSAILI